MTDKVNQGMRRINGFVIVAMYFFCLVSIFLIPPLWAADFKVQTIIENQGVIWGIDFIDAKTLIFTERKGKVSVLNLQTKKVLAISGAPKVFHSGQGGLLDVALDPNFSNNQVLYFSYSKSVAGGATTALAKAKLQNQNDKYQLQELKDIFIAKAVNDNKIHFGSRIAFDGNGHLFLTIGDRGERKEAQNLSSHQGKVLRLTLDGKAAKGNPFEKQKNALPEIWSYGHRNPQGLFYDAKTKRLWEIEHGPRGGDEINLIEAGKNYGWPVITYGKEYWGLNTKIGEGTHKEGMEQPIKYYVPSIAPSGLLVYQGRMFPTWQGNLFSGALALTHLNMVTIAGKKPTQEKRFLEDKGLRIRDVIEAPGGELFLATDSGTILRLYR